jgi:hypothetical protein
MPKRTSSLGVVSLILGVVAFLLCWIPFIGVLSIPLSGLGVLLAGIGLLVALFRRGSGIGWPIGGGVVSGLALIIGIAQVAAIGGVAEGIRQSAERATRTHQEVVTAGPSGNTSQVESDRTSGNEKITGQKRSVSPQWALAANPVRQGDIEMRVTQVLKGKVPLRTGFDDRETTSQDDLLAIHIEMKNLSQSKKVEYSSWQGRDMAFSRDYATLRDNFGNGYKRIAFGLSTEIVGQTQYDSIYPGKNLADVLVFELPVDTAEYLNLELPAKNFGGEGMLRLRIPANMIQHREAKPTKPIPGASVEGGDSSQDAKTSEAELAALRAYAKKVLLRDVHVGKSVFDEQGVFGEIKNTGDRTLSKVQITVFCLDAKGSPVSEETYTPINDATSSWSTRGYMPLRPNYAQKFGYKVKSTSDWSGRVRVEVTDLAFARKADPAFPVETDAVKKAYLPNIELRDVQKGESTLGEAGVFGEVKNTGQRILTKIEVVIYCLDEEGRRVFEKHYSPLLVTQSSFSMDPDTPLKPNYTENFGCKMDDAPSDWSGKVRIAIYDIAFGK